MSRIIKTIPGVTKANPLSAHALSNAVLTKDTKNYQYFIGMLKFLANSTHLDIACAANQRSRF